MSGATIWGRDGAARHFVDALAIRLGSADESMVSGTKKAKSRRLLGPCPYAGDESDLLGGEAIRWRFLTNVRRDNAVPKAKATQNRRQHPPTRRKCQGLCRRAGGDLRVSRINRNHFHFPLGLCQRDTRE